MVVTLFALLCCGNSVGRFVYWLSFMRLRLLTYLLCGIRLMWVVYLVVCSGTL